MRSMRRVREEWLRLLIKSLWLHIAESCIEVPQADSRHLIHTGQCCAVWWSVTHPSCRQTQNSRPPDRIGRAGKTTRRLLGREASISKGSGEEAQDMIDDGLCRGAQDRRTGLGACVGLQRAWEDSPLWRRRQESSSVCMLIIPNPM